MKVKSFEQIADILAAVDIRCYGVVGFPTNIQIVWRHKGVDVRKLFLIGELNVKTVKMICITVKRAIRNQLQGALEEI